MQGNCQSSVPRPLSLLFDICFAAVAVAFAVCRKSISFQIYLAQDVERGLLCGTARGGRREKQKGRTNAKLIKWQLAQKSMQCYVKCKSQIWTINTTCLTQSHLGPHVEAPPPHPRELQFLVQIAEYLTSTLICIHSMKQLRVWVA